jgi:hypothetical protein
VGIAVVAGVLAIGVGFATAGDGSTTQGSGGMMGSGSMVGGTMSAGMATMMAGVDMEAMHDQTMAAMAGKIPSDVLARCDALHDQMWSDAGTDGAEGTGHSAHHGNAGSTG